MLRVYNNRVRSYNKLRRSDYAEKIIYLDGKPISFDAVPFMRSMLNSTAEKEVIRRVAKLVSLQRYPQT